MTLTDLCEHSAGLSASAELLLKILSLADSVVKNPPAQVLLC